MSTEEKLDLFEQYFLDKVEPYSVAELESLVPKAIQSIKFPLIKQLLTQLVADNRVETDKIGTSNFYWCFPSQAAASRKRKVDTLNGEIEELETKKQKLEEEIEQESENKQESEERTKQLERLEQLREMKQELDKELQQYADLDPDLIRKIEEDVVVAKEAVERNTDNIFELKKICTTKYGMDGKTFDQYFGLPEDFDYVE